MITHFLNHIGDSSTACGKDKDKANNYPAERTTIVRQFVSCPECVAVMRKFI